MKKRKKKDGVWCEEEAEAGGGGAGAGAVASQPIVGLCVP